MDFLMGVFGAVLEMLLRSSRVMRSKSKSRVMVRRYDCGLKRMMVLLRSDGGLR